MRPLSSVCNHVDNLVSWLLCGSYSWCHGFVCSLWLWYFLIILTSLFLQTVSNWTQIRTDSIWIQFHCLTFCGIPKKLSWKKNQQMTPKTWKITQHAKSWRWAMPCLLSVNICLEQWELICFSLEKMSMSVSCEMGIIESWVQISKYFELKIPIIQDICHMDVHNSSFE